MSPWSRRLRVLVLLVLGMAPLGQAGAQETAILRVGPEPARGIPYLRANALRGFRGAYVVGPRDFQLQAQGEALAGSPGPDGRLPEPESAEVFYTRAPLVLPQDWSGTRCGSLRLLAVTDQEEFTLCYRDEQGWTLFFAFPRPAEPPAWACGFAESFVRRFQVLLGFVDASREPPFPAILQLGR